VPSAGYGRLPQADGRWRHSKGQWRRSPTSSRTGAKRRPVLLSVAGVALIVVALGGWLAASGSGPAPRPHHSSKPHLTTAPRSSFVDVNGQALAGQPASSVARQLRQLGLHVTVTSVAAHGQPPGTVLWIQPDGRVKAGSQVVIMAASEQPWFGGFGHGHGPGYGNGHGDGGDNGNGQGGND
jgi:hypothetical protein